MKTADLYYIALKARHPKKHSRAVQYAEGVTLAHNLDPEIAATVESACILLACELLEVDP